MNGRLKGRVDDLVYYESKVGGHLVRVQNAAMSQRVKDDPAFANTRRNAREFGAAGALAGAIVRPVSLRWRYILDSITTGKLAKAIYDGMKRDTQNPWGQRNLPLAEMAGIQDLYNGFSKNEMIDEIVQGLAGATYSDGDHMVYMPDESSIQMTAETAQKFIDAGAEGFTCRVSLLRITKPMFDETTGTYSKPYCIDIVRSLADNDFGEGNDIINGSLDMPQVGGNYLVPQNSANVIGGLLVVFMPYKVVNNEKYILQEMCSAYWTAIPDEE